MSVGKECLYPVFLLIEKYSIHSDYFEPCSTIAMALETGVPAVIGALDIDVTVFEKFKNYIIRPNDIDNVM